jgi:hypothetical protein
LRELAEATSRSTGVRRAFDCPQPVRVPDSTLAGNLYRIAEARAPQCRGAAANGLPWRRSLLFRERATPRDASPNFDPYCHYCMNKLSSLVIDDEPNARMRLRRFMKDDERVEVSGEAKDGLEAVTEIQRLRPDLVFLDVQMPGWTVLQLCHPNCRCR